MFDVTEFFIQCNKDSCCEHVTVGVNIYLYVSIILLTPECAVCVRACVRARACVCVCVCVISNQGTSEKPHVSNLSKLDALLHKNASRS